MDSKIRHLFLYDCSAIGVSMVALWAMVLFAATAVCAVTASPVVRALILAAAILICLFSTAALFAVFAHIKRNREPIYTLDIRTSAGQRSKECP